MWCAENMDITNHRLFEKEDLQRFSLLRIWCPKNIIHLEKWLCHMEDDPSRQSVTVSVAVWLAGCGMSDSHYSQGHRNGVADQQVCGTSLRTVSTATGMVP